MVSGIVDFAAIQNVSPTVLEGIYFHGKLIKSMKYVLEFIHTICALPSSSCSEFKSFVFPYKKKK